MLEVWNMGPKLCDLLLWSLYTPDELRGLAARSGHELRQCCRLDPHVRTMLAAQVACQSQCLFAEAVQEDLDQKCEDAHVWIVDQLIDGKSSDVLAVALGPLDDVPFALAELLGAVARLHSPKLVQVQRMLEWRLIVEGVRQHHFGKVEIIEIDRVARS